MSKRTKYMIFSVTFIIVALYINHGVANYDMKYYHGKDNGYLLRFASICILSSFYFAIMTDSNKIVNGLIGLVSGFILGILSYILTMITVPDQYDGTAYYIISFLLFILTFIIVEKRRKIKKH